MAFAFQYLETEEINQLSDILKERLGYSLVLIAESNFSPYKVGTPFIADGIVVVDGVEFPDCIETAIRHFFNLIQPTDPALRKQYWRTSQSSAQSEVAVFFMRKQKVKRANDGNSEFRTLWARTLSKLSELSYKRKTQESLPANDVELKAGWSNYLKAIAYLKKDFHVWKNLRRFDNSFSVMTKDSIKLICDSFVALLLIKELVQSSGA